MWTTLADQAALLPILFLVDGDYVQPSEASVSLLDQTGAVLMADVSLDVSSTSTTFHIPVGFTSLAQGEAYRHLFVRGSFTGPTFTGEIQQVIRVQPFIPLLCSPDDVRTLLGLNDIELPSDRIDLVYAYRYLLSDYPELEAALLDSSLQLVANRAVSLQSALLLLPSLNLLVLQKTQAEDQQLTRFTSDWAALGMHLEHELQALLDRITGEDAVETAIDHFGFAAPTDALTGE